MPRPLNPIVTYLLDRGLRDALKHRPADMSLAEMLEVLLCIKDRHIRSCLIRRPFTIPGVYLEDGVHAIHGFKTNYRATGGACVVRWDERDDFVDLEYKNGVWRIPVNVFIQYATCLSPSTPWPRYMLSRYRDSAS